MEQEKIDELKKKLLEKLNEECPDFAETVTGLASDKLEKNLLLYTKYLENVYAELETDDEVNKLKASKKTICDALKNALKSYKDSIRVLKLKLAYVNLLFEERQQVIEDVSEEDKEEN